MINFLVFRNPSMWIIPTTMLTIPIISISNSCTKINGDNTTIITSHSTVNSTAYGNFVFFIKKLNTKLDSYFINFLFLMVNEMSIYSISIQKTNIITITILSSCKISNMDSMIGMTNNNSIIKKERDDDIFNISGQQ